MVPFWEGHLLTFRSVVIKFNIKSFLAEALRDVYDAMDKTLVISPFFRFTFNLVTNSYANAGPPCPQEIPAPA